jgi:hypothetical protein
MTPRRLPLSMLLLPAVLLAAASGAAAQEASTRLLGEVRVRGEAERPATTDTTDAFTLLRSRLAVEAALSPRAVILLQVQDSRTFGEEMSTLDGSANQLDMHQAWLQYRADIGLHALTARAGRQEVVLGNERLLGAVGWSNVGRSFDAARVAFRPAGGRWQVHGLAAVVQERSVRLGGDRAMGDHMLLGAWLESGAADIFALHDRAATYRTFTGVDRTTVGGHVRLPERRALAASLEGSFQFGNQVRTDVGDLFSQDIRAWMAGARAGYETGVWQVPRLGAGVDVLSGDADPADGTYRAFNTLYATNHRFYGFMDLFLDPAARTQDRGLIDGILSARVGLPADLALDIDAHGFWLHREFAGTGDRMLGWEIDFTLPVSLGPGQQVHVGYSLFRSGNAAPLIGLGAADRTSHWGYIQASFAVGGRPAALFWREALTCAEGRARPAVPSPRFLRRRIPRLSGSATP